jgi:hypothetical protein
MTRRSKGNGSVAAVVAGVVALSFVVCGVLLGLERAWPIARDAALGVAMDPLLVRSPDAGSIPLVEVQHGPDGTGVFRTPDDAVPVRVQVSDQGIVIDLERPLGDEPYARSILRLPATVDGVQGQAALWLVGIAGAPVAGQSLVLARVNGAKPRLMELSEVVGPDMEQVRGLSPLPVQVGAVVPVPAWGGVEGFSGQAAQRAAALERTLADTLLTAYARRDTIAAVVDLDAYLRLLAGWELLARTPAQCVWTYSPRTHRFMPVLVRAVLEADTAITAEEGLAAIVLGDPGWRAQRDALVRSGAELALAQDRFDKAWGGWMRSLSAIPAKSRVGAAMGQGAQVEASGTVRMRGAAELRRSLQERLRAITNTGTP